ncbi:hypothetical protein [Pseudobacteroides cellulosolvens]|uniref:Putative RNA polymerase, sigma 28 subunit, FliA/WhiG subfamily n=1 Tax=Pseudobacteroides cellulosolvens ATCC 35603 = DSM 2933 TaxID=398512 RepID=A0A0L6JGV3_9FIRM|nr:hypothetical protein [Pseudobacteroides cellulosolvens]KNY24953.1 putative RNA polymerase, sigma 28 subunit, FliA/WhiG subfamily [Pseudobacteroides cellulosolvens ATCC 35603 = DSM 2933]
MSSSNFFSRDKLSRENLKTFIEGLRLGDNESRSDFIDENKSFILKVVSNALKRSTIPQNSKEFEIGLSSFNYAIDTYDLESNDDFLTYAEKVIKNSIYDFIKFESSNSTTYNAQIESEYLYRDYENKDEISRFKLKLWELGITLDSLVKVTPVDKESINTSLSIVRKFLSNHEVFQKITSKSGIPYDMLDKDTKNNKKFIEKHKDYIIALALILNSNLGIFKSYLKNTESGNRPSDNVGIILELFKDKALFFTLEGKFTINNIKSNPTLYIGKQMLINSDYIKRPSNITKYSVFAASFFIITLTLLVGFTYLLRDDSTTVYSPKDPDGKNVAVSDGSMDKNPTVPVVTATASALLSPTPKVSTQSPSFVPAVPTSEPLYTSTPIKPTDTKNQKQLKKYLSQHRQQIKL